MKIVILGGVAAGTKIAAKTDAGGVQNAEVLILNKGAGISPMPAAAGYIGLEIAENLAKDGVKPFVLDMAPHVLPGFDGEFATYIEGKLADARHPGGHRRSCDRPGGKAAKSKKVLTDRKAHKADLVVLSAGIQPNTAFLDGTGLEMVKEPC